MMVLRQRLRGAAARWTAAALFMAASFCSTTANAQGISETDAVAYVEMFMEAAAATAPTFDGVDVFFRSAGFTPPEVEGEVWTAAGGFALATLPDNDSTRFLMTVVLAGDFDGRLGAAVARGLVTHFGFDVATAKGALSTGFIEIGQGDDAIAISVVSAQLETGEFVYSIAAIKF